MITIERGRVRIPTKDVIHILKPGLGKAKKVITETLPGVTWDRDAWTVLADYHNVVTVNSVFKVKLPIPEKTPKALLTFPFKTVPMTHQHNALIACNRRSAFAYLMEPGTGKTKVAIDDMQILNREGELDSVLVLCPKSIKNTWLREIETHGWSDDWEILLWVTGHKKAYCDTYQQGPPDGTAPMRWLIMNIDALIYSHGWKIANKFIMSSGSAAIIIDESTTIKNISATRTLRVISLGINAKYRRILTGTPIAHTPVDYYAQLTFLDSNIFFGWSVHAFKTHFCIMGGYKKKEILGYINQAELASIVAQHSFQATKDECLNLPSRVFQIREVEPDLSFWTTYEAIVDEVLLSVDGSLMTTQLIVQKITKLRQLIGGWLLPDWPKDKKGKPIKKGKREPVLIDPNRVETMIEIMEEFRGTKGIIWCYYEHEVVNVTKYLRDQGWNPVPYYGKLSDKQRVINEAAFEKGEADIFVSQIDTGGMGLTLNAASFMIYFNRPVYLLPRTQSLDRNYRKGQTKKTTVIDLVIPGTLDESNLESLNSKQDLADRLMRASRDPEALSDLLIKNKKRKWKQSH